MRSHTVGIIGAPRILGDNPDSCPTKFCGSKFRVAMADRFNCAAAH